MKTCSKCKEEKTLQSFSKNKRVSDGYSQQCKSCIKEYRNRNRDSILEKQREYHNRNRDSILEKQREYYDNNKDIIRDKQIEYYNKNKEEILFRKKKYNDLNKDIIRENKKKYYQGNKDIIKEKQREYKKIKRQDSLFRFKSNIKNIIGASIRNRGYLKKSKSEVILGCDLFSFIIYIESKFESWMSWENYGLYNGDLNYGWDIDHIIPISSAKTEEDVIKLNHYTNLQPLCSYINRVRKGSKLDYK